MASTVSIPLPSTRSNFSQIANLGTATSPRSTVRLARIAVVRTRSERALEGLKKQRAEAPSRGRAEQSTPVSHHEVNPTAQTDHTGREARRHRHGRREPDFCDRPHSRPEVWTLSIRPKFERMAVSRSVLPRTRIWLSRSSRRQSLMLKQQQRPHQPLRSAFGSRSLSRGSRPSRARRLY